MARGGLGNRGGGRGRGGQGGRGNTSGRGRGVPRTTQLLQRVAAARTTHVPPPGFALVPLTQPAFPVTQALNIANGMANADVEAATVEVGPNQGPRSALLMLINPIPDVRPVNRVVRRMDWSCICDDLSCANNLSVAALSAVSATQYYTWLVNHKIVWQVTYCTKQARIGRNMKVLGHRGNFAIRMRLNSELKRHVCPHPTCRAKVCHLGPMSNGHGWHTPLQLTKATLCMVRGETLAEVISESEISENTLIVLRQRYDRLLAGLQFHRNRVAKGTILICQADEFCFGKTLYDRGAPMTAVGQMWFQSIAEVNTDGKCTRFFIRPVQNRTTFTLCSWIAEMICNNATVITDCWAATTA